MVVIHHLATVFQPSNSGLHSITSLGAYGVDLFFVLSGWLIGRLYFREKIRRGVVGGYSFWMRRALRTMPPYYCVLLVAWASVYFYRKEAFSWTYLAFMQNYLGEMPFFFASWSLCVEEHFYMLVIPVLALVGRSYRSTPVLLLTATVMPLALRVTDPAVQVNGPFGYSVTATHLRTAGITLGVAAAWVAEYDAPLWSYLQKYARWMAVPALATFASIACFPRPVRFYLGPEIVAIIALIQLAAVAGKKPIPGASGRVVYHIAITSYSVYLTHGLVLQLVAVLNKQVLHLPAGLLMTVAMPLLAAVGYLYFRLVELPAIKVRDYLVPRK
jgi:peptidoglycan/LPS O-acetylase OafA/YrhL